MPAIEGIIGLAPNGVQPLFTAYQNALNIVAGSDLPERGRLVDLTTGNYPTITGGSATNGKVGVSINKAVAVGEQFGVVIEGKASVLLGGNVTAFAALKAMSSGRMMAATPGTDMVHAIALTDGASGSTIEVFLLPSAVGYSNKFAVKVFRAAGTGDGTEQSIAHGMALVPTFVDIDARTQPKIFQSAEQTSSQASIAHGLGQTPDAYWGQVTDLNGATSPALVLTADGTNISCTCEADLQYKVFGFVSDFNAAGFTATQGTHTSTNILVTATSGRKYDVLALAILN